jgi:flagellar assembly protein FliH
MAGIIRRETPIASSVFSLTEVEREADDLLRSARAQAEAIRAEARVRAEAVEAQRYKEGHERGLAEGRAAATERVERESRAAALNDARARLESLLQALQAGVADFDAAKRRLIASAELGLIRLAVQIAERVCKQLVDASSETARQNALRVLELVQHEHDLRLCVHPDEHALLQEVAADFVRSTQAGGHVEVMADPRVARGGCVLRSRDGEIDASIRTQLDRIAQAIAGGRPDPGAGDEGSCSGEDKA